MPVFDIAVTALTPAAEPENSGKYREYAASLAKLAAGRLVAGDLDIAREALTEALGWCEVMRYLASLEQRAAAAAAAAGVGK